LFRDIIKGIFGITPTRAEKPEMLRRLRDEGVYVIDVVEEPEGAHDLKAHVGELVARCRGLAPDSITLVKATVYDAVYEPLHRAGIARRELPGTFPGSGQQRRFEEQFALALRLVG
jgi:hypothetical protein